MIPFDPFREQRKWRKSINFGGLKWRSNDGKKMREHLSRPAAKTARHHFPNSKSNDLELGCSANSEDGIFSGARRFLHSGGLSDAHSLIIGPFRPMAIRFRREREIRKWPIARSGRLFLVFFLFRPRSARGPRLASGSRETRPSFVRNSLATRPRQKRVPDAINAQP